MCEIGKIIGLSDDALIECFSEDAGLPSRPLKEFTIEELYRLITVMLIVIRDLAETLISKKILDEEEYDTLKFRAGRDSSTSSYRPSSDMYRKKAAKDPDSDATSVNNSQEPNEKTASDTGKEPKEKPAANNADSTVASDTSDTSKDKSNNNQDQSPRPTTVETKQTEDPSASQENGSTKSKTFEEEEKEAEQKLRKDHKRSRRNPSGKKPGKQKDAKGVGFHPPENIEKATEEIVRPNDCKNCERWEECKQVARIGQAHNIYDVEIHIVKKTMKTAEVECPSDGEKKSSEYPDGAKGVNQYGVMVKVIVCLLYCVGMVSLCRIHDIIAPMFMIQLSPATMESMVTSLAVLVKPVVDAILRAEKLEKVVHCDETGSGVNGSLYWIHTIATETYTFVSIQAKRGKEGMDKIGFLAAYVGTVVHDCWSSYWKFANVLHATCNEHLERELAGLSKYFKNAKLWADDMNDLLQEMLHRKHEAMESGLTALSAEELTLFENRYDAVIAKGKELHPIPERPAGKRGKTKKGRARALIDRMEEKKEEIFRFLTDFNVPYTNNTAERAFRLLGIKSRVGPFRDLHKAEDFCAIWSYVATAKKKNISYFKAVHEAFLGNAMSTIFPEGEPNPENLTRPEKEEQDSQNAHATDAA